MANKITFSLYRILILRNFAQITVTVLKEKKKEKEKTKKTVTINQEKRFLTKDH